MIFNLHKRWDFKVCTATFYTELLWEKELFLVYKKVFYSLKTLAGNTFSKA
jgi:hypothetical protein